MHRTAWTQQHSSVTSDRIKPSRPSSSQSSSKGKERNANSGQEPPKSREVRRLEGLLSALRASQSPKKDPKGGCFCQAREHSLSPYTPICRTCGLILCDINQPNFACPHCLASLTSSNIRDSLINRLEQQLDETIAKEVAARERVIEEAKREAGAFPTLSGSTTPTPSKPPVLSPQPQTRKVISLGSNSKTKSKKVTISSYTTTPVSSRPASRSETEDEGATIVRIPPPSAEVRSAHRDIDPSRPWANLLNENPVYLPAPAKEVEGSAGRKGRQSKGKGKEKEKENEDNESVS